MSEYLCGDIEKPPITSPKIWNYSLPSVDNLRGHALIQEYRCTWSFSMGFGSMFSFADYNALRMDAIPDIRYKLCTVQGGRQRMFFHRSPTWLLLPGVALRASGVHGLAIKMPRVLHYFGGACAGLHDLTCVRGVGRRLDSCLRLDMLHATICALHHEFISVGCVWLASDKCLDCLEFLESFEFIPPLRHDRSTRSLRLAEIV